MAPTLRVRIVIAFFLALLLTVATTHQALPYLSEFGGNAYAAEPGGCGC